MTTAQVDALAAQFQTNVNLLEESVTIDKLLTEYDSWQTKREKLLVEQEMLVCGQFAKCTPDFKEAMARRSVLIEHDLGLVEIAAHCVRNRIIEHVKGLHSAQHASSHT